MTPAEKKASELAEQHINDPSRTGQKYNENDLKRISDFKAGFFAALELEEVKGLENALESLVISDQNKERMDDVDCETRKMLLMHISLIASEAITAWRSFRGEK